MSRETYEVRWKDYYQVLGIEPSATLRTIRQAWQRLSQDYHPDVAGNSKANLARIKKLDEAYEVLSDRDRRAKYDQAYQARGKKSPKTSAARPVSRRTRQSPPLPASTPMPMPPRSQQEEPPPVPLALGPRSPAPPGIPSVAGIQSNKVANKVANKVGLLPFLTEKFKVTTAFTRKTYEAYRNLLSSGKAGPSPTRRTRLIAAAGAIGVVVLMGIGVAPALFRDNEPSAPTPTAFNPITPTPLPEPALPAYPSEMPAGTPAPGATTEPTQVSPEPTPKPMPGLPPTSTLPPKSTLPSRSPILVMSPEAEALGFRGFQVSGNPWMVNFSGECQEAPCLRSGAIWGDGFSTLSLNYLNDLPSSVRTISFDVKTTSPACCASFQIVARPNPVTVDLPSGSSWTRVEVAVPETRPLAFQWEFRSGPSGVSGLDGIWVDNIQFK